MHKNKTIKNKNKFLKGPIIKIKTVEYVDKLRGTYFNHEYINGKRW